MVNYIIDVSWMLYRGYFSAKNIWENYPEIHFLTKKLNSLLQNKDVVIHLCLDGYMTKGKRILGENYKSGRHQNDGYNVYKGLATFVSLLNSDRIKLYYNPNYESDELIFTLSRTLDGRKKIMTGDKDLLQSLKKDVVIEMGKGPIITEESYKFGYEDKFFGIDPIKLPLFRAICGDPSDTLYPPVARFPHKLAARIVNDIVYNGNLPDKQELLDISKNYTDTEKNWINKLIIAYDKFNTNFEIMKLNVITDDIRMKYSDPKFEFDDFLTHKITELNKL